MPWTEPAARTEVFREIERNVASRVRQRGLAVVWAAGSTGFAAGEEEAAGELAAFTDVVDFVERAPVSDGASPTTFHLISSAGGLFEGSAMQSLTDMPSPLRPYGHLKLAQEQYAAHRLPADTVFVYRPSSVYTGAAEGRRPGLIGALIRDGLAHRSTTIVGALGTLRDYVLADDVAAYVADSVLDAASPGVHMLVAGRPASILQVITAVESAIRRRLYIRIAGSWNARNITFSPDVRAEGFATAPLQVGVRTVLSARVGRPVTD